MKQRVVVTGGGGFIGARLIDRWACMPDLDVVVADLSTGVDLAEPGWSNALPCKHADIVFHLAQSKHYREFPAEAQDIFSVNVVGAFEILDWSRRHGVQRVVLASSGSVYAPADRKLLETDTCLPTSMYTASKLAAEAISRPYAAFFQIVVARLFTVYGPGQTGMLIPEMIRRVQMHDTIELADGKGILLTPTSVTDCVEALTLLGTVPLREPWCAINVAGDEAISLGEIVREIGVRAGKEPVVLVTDARPTGLCGDNTAIRTLGATFVSFSTGLDAMFHHPDQNRPAPTHGHRKGGGAA